MPYDTCMSACNDLALVPSSCLEQFASYLLCVAGATSVSVTCGSQRGLRAHLAGGLRGRSPGDVELQRAARGSSPRASRCRGTSRARCRRPAGVPTRSSASARRPAAPPPSPNPLGIGVYCCPSGTATIPALSPGSEAPASPAPSSGATGASAGSVAAVCRRPGAVCRGVERAVAPRRRGRPRRRRPRRQGRRATARRPWSNEPPSSVAMTRRVRPRSCVGSASSRLAGSEACGILKKTPPTQPYAWAVHGSPLSVHETFGFSPQSMSAELPLQQGSEHSVAA